MNREQELKTEWMKTNIKEGMIVVDIGACVGLYTSLLSDLVSNTGKVFAFEPRSDNFKKLSELTVDRKNVTLERAGIADFNTDAAILYVYNYGYIGWNSFLSDTPWMHNTDLQETVSLYRLDDYLEKLGIHQIDFIKMDVEGYDLPVLKSCQKIINNTPTIKFLMEIHTYQHTQEDILNFFFDNKFTIFGLMQGECITTTSSQCTEIIAIRG